jgi:hypothetical protein
MMNRAAARGIARLIPVIRVADLFVVVAVAATLFGNSLLSAGPSRGVPNPPASSIAVAPAIAAGRSMTPGAVDGRAPVVPNAEVPLGPGAGGALGAADGVLPDRVTVVDDQYPAVARLNTDLLLALRRATIRAAKDDVELFVTSGWRSRRYQEALFDEAVSQYGSAEKAGLWVATPGTSAHESGKAVDLGPIGATAWLSRHGAAYGLCQIYRNEPWHYELRPEAINSGCPRMYADPTKDPRMQQ